jgi:hypothetical protein
MQQAGLVFEPQVNFIAELLTRLKQLDMTSLTGEQKHLLHADYVLPARPTFRLFLRAVR